MTLDKLMDEVAARTPKGQCTIRQREYRDGSSHEVMFVDRKLCAAWRGRLVTPPPIDGKTPRGPKEYYDVRFFDANHPEN